MDPASLTQLAQQTTLILAPALPYIYAGGKTVANKTGDMLLEKGIEKVSFAGWKKANMLMDRISPKMTIALKKPLYMHPKTPKIKKKKRFSTRDLEIIKRKFCFCNSN